MRPNKVSGRDDRTQSLISSPLLDLADRITGAGKAITSYLDATTDSGNHARLVQLIDALDAISELVAYETVSWGRRHAS